LSAVYEAVADCLRRLDPELSEDREHNAVVAEYEGDAGTWLVVGEADEERELAAVTAVVRGLVTPEHREPVALLLTRINLGLALGAFTLDLDEGQVRFRASVDFAGSEPDERLIRPLATMCLAAPERWLAAIVAVATGADVADAFAAAANA
jgi:hypothetical protein